jgi:hypothetical protein
MTGSSSKSNDRPVRKPAVPRIRYRVVQELAAPRPMTALATALMDRRRRRVAPVAASASMPACGDPAAALVLQAQDGTVTYTVAARHAGVLVGRTTTGRADLQVTQILYFSIRAAFDQWCESDPMRFEQPQLHQGLRRAAQELFHGESTEPGAT